MAKNGKIDISDQHEYIRCAEKDSNKGEQACWEVEEYDRDAPKEKEMGTVCKWLAEPISYGVFQRGDEIENADPESEQVCLLELINARISFLGGV
jgi:hypothetical protein